MSWSSFTRVNFPVHIRPDPWYNRSDSPGCATVISRRWPNAFIEGKKSSPSGALCRFNRLDAALDTVDRRANVEVLVGKRSEDTKKASKRHGVLFEEGDVRITEADVSKAIEEARQRVGPEFAELLTAPAMTDEEMDELEGLPAEE